MRAAVVSTQWCGWLLKKGELLHHRTTVASIFAFKTFGASLLALYIAFWAGLDDPRWAFLTVFVVSQPDSGLVLAKSFYRILGTIAGVLVTVALIFGLAQYGELFVTAVALWIGLCNFAARAVRNFASYGFQLAGYTVAIVGIPAALDPNGAYPLVLARFTEIALGIICAALVSRLILVREISPKLVELVRALTRRAQSFATVLLSSDPEHKQVVAERTELAEAYLDVQAMQHSAYFESADARVLDRPLHRLILAAAELCATAEAAAGHLRDSLPLPKSDTSLGNTIPRPNEAASGDDAIVSAVVRTADDRDLALARARLRVCMEAFERGDEVPRSSIACRLWSDPVPAVMIGIRSALAIGITSTFWFVTAWPHGPVAVIVAAVLCSLLASLDQPEKISMAAAATVLIAAVPVFATQFYLMPLAVDFPSMAVALAPLLLTCSFIMAQPRIGPLGLLSAVYFAFASNIDNVMTYDAAAFLNSSLAILVGIAVAVVLFATFFPESPAFAVRRFRHQLVVHLGDLVRASRGAAMVACYENALFEQLATTLVSVQGKPKVAHECWASALTALSVAQAVGRLKGPLQRPAVPPEIMYESLRLLARLSQTLRNPITSTLRERAREALALTRDALDTARRSVQSDEIEALSGIVAGSATLGFDLMRLSTRSQEKLNAIRI
jgi:uncharacterized membrane protein YccC